MRMKHPQVDNWEFQWLCRWVKGEPTFGPHYGRQGNVARFFEWRREQLIA